MKVWLVRYERSRDNSDTIAVMATREEAEALAERLFPNAEAWTTPYYLEPWKRVAKVSTLDDVTIEEWTVGVPRNEGLGDEPDDPERGDLTK